MKTTLEIPDATFRKAKSKAAAEGLSFRAFVTEALEEKLRRERAFASNDEPEWLRLAGVFGKSQADRTETRRIQAAIDREFETIEAEDQD